MKHQTQQVEWAIGPNPYRRSAMVPTSVSYLMPAPAQLLLGLVLFLPAVKLQAEPAADGDSRQQQFRRLAVEAAQAAGLPVTAVPAEKAPGKIDAATFRQRALQAAKKQRADAESLVQPLIVAIASEGATYKALDALVDEHQEDLAAAVLAQALQLDSEEMRYFAASQLVELGFSARLVVTELVNALQDENEHVRGRVASALGEIGPEARVAVPALIVRLSDPSSHVRADASEALGKIRLLPKHVVPALVAALQDEDSHVRFMTVEAIGEFKAEAAAAAEPLRQALLHDTDSNVRWHTTGPLAAVDPEGKIAIPALLEALPSSDANIRRFAASALGQFGPLAKVAVPLLSVGLNDKDAGTRIAAAGALWQVNGNTEDTVPVLVRILEQEVSIAHLWAATELAKMGPAAKEAVPALRKSLAKTPWPDEPACALGNIGMEAAAAVPDLVALLESEKSEAKACAVGALWKINRHPRALPTLQKALKEPVPYRAAIVAGDIGPEAKVCVPELLNALRDQNRYVRRAAAKALEKVDLSAVPAR